MSVVGLGVFSEKFFSSIDGAAMIQHLMQLMVTKYNVLARALTK